MEGEIASNVGTVGTITLAIGAAVTWGISAVLKRFGITPSSFGDKNDRAAKDMLDFLQAQLKAEVDQHKQTKEEAEQLRTALGTITKQFDRLEFQNERLQEQVKTLTATVEELKLKLPGGTR